MRDIPYYWRLSGFYLFYFALLGTLVPYWALYLPMPICFFLVAVEFVRYLIGIDSYYSYDLSEVKDSV